MMLGQNKLDRTVTKQRPLSSTLWYNFNLTPFRKFKVMFMFVNLLLYFFFPAGQMYFLSGKKYYEVNRRIRRVEKSSPGLFTVDFMGCDSVKNWSQS